MVYSFLSSRLATVRCVPGCFPTLSLPTASLLEFRFYDARTKQNCSRLIHLVANTCCELPAALGCTKHCCYASRTIFVSMGTKVCKAFHIIVYKHSVLSFVNQSLRTISFVLFSFFMFVFRRGWNTNVKFRSVLLYCAPFYCDRSISM